VLAPGRVVNYSDGPYLPPMSYRGSMPQPFLIPPSGGAGLVHLLRPETNTAACGNYSSRLLPSSEDGPDMCTLCRNLLAGMLAERFPVVPEDLPDGDIKKEPRA